MVTGACAGDACGRNREVCQVECPYVFVLCKVGHRGTTTASFCTVRLAGGVRLRNISAQEQELVVVTRVFDEHCVADTCLWPLVRLGPVAHKQSRICARNHPDFVSKLNWILVLNLQTRKSKTKSHRGADTTYSCQGYTYELL